MRRILKNVARSIITPVSLAAVALATAAAVGTIQYGSPAAAVASVRGEAVQVDASTKSFGRKPVGEQLLVPFTLTNLSSRPVKVVGGTSSCGCTAPENLPLTLEPRAKRTIEVSVRTGSTARSFEEVVELYTEPRQDARIILKVVGEVTPPKVTE